LNKTLSHLKTVLRFDNRGEVIISEQHENTLNTFLELTRNTPSTFKVHFAQFHNMGDHLGAMLRHEGESSYKVLPWAEPHKFIPYMLFRSQELAHLSLPLTTQAALVRHELLTRVMGV
jgi:hypothetical protein